MICGNPMQNPEPTIPKPVPAILISRQPLHASRVCRLQGRQPRFSDGNDAVQRKKSERYGETWGGGRDERLRKQKEYQEEYRKQIKAARAPNRDEIARELLHHAITENLKRNRRGELGELGRNLVKRLVARGYDLEASRKVFIKIVGRYEKGWTFQRRVHLLQPPEDGTADDGDSRH
jgi:hypothetical protein